MNHARRSGSLSHLRSDSWSGYNNPTKIAQVLTDQVKESAPKVAASLFGQDGPSGYRRVSDTELLDRASRRWADPMYRQQLLQQVGNDKFLWVGSHLGFYSENQPQVPPTAAGGVDGGT